MKQLLILLVLITCTVQAEIYKSQNEKGEWVYSDTPSPNSERMKLPPLSTYTAPPVPPHSTSAAVGGSGIAYETMVFAEPENDATIRDNRGVVKVSVGLDPSLKIQQGHKIQFYLDGNPYGEAVASSEITVKDVDRGTHVLGAQVLSARGGLLLRAEPVTFHLQRNSSKNPKNLNNPDNPKSLRNPENIANNPNNPYHIKNNPNAPGPINPNPPKPKPTPPKPPPPKPKPGSL